MQLIHGECLEEMDKLPDGCVDMVLTDPPYGTTACKWDAVIPLWPMWLRLKRLIKPNGAIVMTASQPFTTTLIASNMEMFKYCWVWNKKCVTGFLNSKRQPLRQHEDIVVFYAKQPTYNPQMHADKLDRDFRGHEIKPSTENYGKQRSYISDVGPKESYPRSVLTITGLVNNSREKVNHPTQKPVALMEYLIKTYTNEGETVLDFTMGSGTTGVACKNLNREFIGIEKDEKYFEIAKKRIESTKKRV